MTKTAEERKAVRITPDSAGDHASVKFCAGHLAGRTHGCTPALDAIAKRFELCEGVRVQVPDKEILSIWNTAHKTFEAFVADVVRRLKMIYMSLFGEELDVIVETTPAIA